MNLFAFFFLPPKSTSKGWLKIDSAVPGSGHLTTGVDKKFDVEENDLVISDDHLKVDLARASPIEIQAANHSNLIPSEPT